MRFLALSLLVLTTFTTIIAEGQVMDDVQTTSEDTPITFSITNNDSDPDGIDETSVDLDILAPLQQSDVTLTEGVFQVDPAGELTFTPANGFTGDATIQYSVQNDLNVLAGSALVTVTVTGANIPPTAANDNASTTQGTPVDLVITSNDSDPDGSIDNNSIDLDLILPLQQTTVITLEGTFTVIGPGEIKFTPFALFSGTATTDYKVADQEGALSNVATISVSVAANTPPVAVADATSTDEGTQTSINVLTNDIDDATINGGTVDLNPAALLRQTTVNVTGGNFTVDNSGLVTFTPADGYAGTATTTYTVSDTQGATSNAAPITITVAPVNENPVANNDAALTDENDPVTIAILDNDTDDVGLDPTTIDLDPSTAGQQTSRSVTGGVFNVSGGEVVFTPTTDFNGSSSASYTVSDNENAVSNIATITVTINSVNPLPVANNDVASTNENTPVNIDILNNDTDDTSIAAGTVDLDPSTPGQQLTRTVTGGSFSFAAGELTLTPSADYNGPVTVTYTVDDSEGATSNIASVNVSVAAVNEDPVAVNDAATTDENDPVTINVLTNDSDDSGLNSSSVDLDPTTAGLQTTRTVTGGSFAVTAGSVTFTPTTNFNGTATGSYTVDDNEGATSNTATITITVTSVNAAPIANNDTGNTDENDPVTINILSNDTDDVGLSSTTVDLNPGTPGTQTTRVVTGGNFSVTAGSLTFTPNTNFNGTASVSYTVDDTEGATSNIATVTITVNSINAN
jgi:hypothetical protein